MRSTSARAARPAQALLAACACLAALAASPVHAADGWTVVTYRCDGNRNFVVGYPPEGDRRSPIRVSWQGRTYMLSPVARQVSTGTRYINGMANLEWWRGRGDTSRLSTVHNVRSLLTNCVPLD